MFAALYPFLKLFLTILATTAVCRLCLRHLFWGGRTQRQRLKERAISNGWVTEGRLSGTDTLRRDSVQARVEGNMGQYHDTVSVTYAYYVNGRAYTCGGYVKPNAYGYHEVADVITVFYDGEDPKRCVMSDESLEQQQKQRGMLLTMLLTALTLALAPHLIDILFGL